MSSFSEIIEYVKDDLHIVKKNIEELSEKSGYSEEISKRLSYVLSSQETTQTSNNITLL